jgi:hypothetical protein
MVLVDMMVVGMVLVDRMLVGMVLEGMMVVGMVLVGMVLVGMVLVDMMVVGMEMPLPLLLPRQSNLASASALFCARHTRPCHVSGLSPFALPG